MVSDGFYKFVVVNCGHSVVTDGLLSGDCSSKVELEMGFNSILTHILSG